MTMPRFRGALLLSRCADLRALPAHDAAEPQRLLGDGLRVGNVLLRPLMLALGQLAQAIIDVLFLTAGLAEQATPVAIASRTRYLPCIISDLSQLHAGRCDGFVHYQTASYATRGLNGADLVAILVHVPGYSSADARAAYRLTTRATLALSAQNLPHDQQIQTANSAVERRVLATLSVDY